MKRTSRRVLPHLLLYAFVASLVLISCTGAPPEATYAQLVLTYTEDRQREEIYEQLTIRVHVQDPDGIDDVETLHVSHDGEGYVWTFDEEKWSRRQEGGTELFVLEGLVSPDGSPLPRGEYRIIAVDSAGHRTEITESIESDPRDSEDLAFPRLELDDDELTVLGDHNEVRVIGYEGEDRRVGELELSGGETRSVARIDWLADRIEEVSLFAIARGRGPRTEHYVESGPYRWE